MRCRAWALVKTATTCLRSGKVDAQVDAAESGNAVAAAVLLLPLLSTALLLIADVATVAANQSRLMTVTSIAARRAAVEIPFGHRDAAAVARTLIRREFSRADVVITQTQIAEVPVVVVEVNARIPAVSGLFAEHSVSARSRAPVEWP